MRVKGALCTPRLANHQEHLYRVQYFPGSIKSLAFFEDSLILGKAKQTIILQYLDYIKLQEKHLLVRKFYILPLPPGDFIHTDCRVWNKGVWGWEGDHPSL